MTSAKDRSEAESCPSGGQGCSLLLWRALGLGDLCAAVPAIKSLRRSFPDHRILLATQPSLAPLAHAAGVDAVLPADWVRHPPPNQEGELAQVLDSEDAVLLEGVDAVVNMHGPGPESLEFLRLLIDRIGPARTRHDPWSDLRSDREESAVRLLSFVRGEAGSAGIRREPQGETLLEWEPQENEYERWIRLVAAWGADGRADDLGVDIASFRGAERCPFLDGPPGAGGAGEPGAARYVLVHPGAASRAREWPPERFAAVINRLLESDRELTVVLTGSEVERPLCVEVESYLDDVYGRVVDLSGKTDIACLGRLMGEAELVLANDSGPAHLAWALGVATVVLFGPTSPEQWGLPGQRAVTEQLRLPVRNVQLWAGRHGDPHASTLDPGLAELSVASVFDACAKVLDSATQRDRGDREVRSSGDPA